MDKATSLGEVNLRSKYHGLAQKDKVHYFLSSIDFAERLSYAVDWEKAEEMGMKYIFIYIKC